MSFPPSSTLEARPGSAPGRNRGLARFAWGVLAYNLVVVVWGAFVRATGSGAGCGRHWPLCNGEVIPRAKSVATMIEASHRATSGIAFIAVLVLLVATLRALPRGHRARRGAAWSFVFMLGEALIGAALVLFELVAHDASMKRAFSIILHLGNTFLLLAALTLTAWWIGHATALAAPKVRAPREGLVRAVVFTALASVLVVGASGAVAALGDTLFPARSLAEGLASDLSPLTHAFVRLRVLHPILAMTAGFVVVATASVVRTLRPSERVRRFSYLLTGLFVAQFTAGIVNVTLLAPVWMQLVHLFLADLVWVALVLTSWEALTSPVAANADGDQNPIMSRNGPGPSNDVPPSTSNVVPVTYDAAGETR